MKLTEEEIKLCESMCVDGSPGQVVPLPDGLTMQKFIYWNEVILPSQKGKPETSDGSTASYYELPEGANELQHLISYRNMNAQIGEIFRACYRMGLVSHSPNIRDVKKIIFYAQAELERLEKYAE